MEEQKELICQMIKQTKDFELLKYILVILQHRETKKS